MLDQVNIMIHVVACVMYILGELFPSVGKVACPEALNIDDYLVTTAFE